MDAGNPLPDAADHPVQVLQGADLGGSGHFDGTEVLLGKCKNGVSKIYGEKLMFVTNVTHVTF